jgi:hypothetical protein
LSYFMEKAWQRKTSWGYLLVSKGTDIDLEGLRHFSSRCLTLQCQTHINCNDHNNNLYVTSTTVLLQQSECSMLMYHSWSSAKLKEHHSLIGCNTVHRNRYVPISPTERHLFLSNTEVYLQYDLVSHFRKLLWEPQI